MRPDRAKTPDELLEALVFLKCNALTYSRLSREADSSLLLIEMTIISVCT